MSCPITGCNISNTYSASHFFICIFICIKILVLTQKHLIMHFCLHMTETKRAVNKNVIRRALAVQRGAFFTFNRAKPAVSSCILWAEISQSNPSVFNTHTTSHLTPGKQVNKCLCQNFELVLFQTLKLH